MDDDEYNAIGTSDFFCDEERLSYGCVYIFIFNDYFSSNS